MGLLEKALRVRAAFGCLKIWLYLDNFGGFNGFEILENGIGRIGVLLVGDGRLSKIPAGPLEAHLLNPKRSRAGFCSIGLQSVFLIL